MRVLALLCLCLFTAVLARPDDDIANLVKQLKDKDEAVRVKAAQTLRKRGVNSPMAVAPALVEAMLDKSTAVRNAAYEALEKVDENIAPHVFQMLYGMDKNSGMESLVRLKRDARNALPAFHHVYKQSSGDRRRMLEMMAAIAPKDKLVAQLTFAHLATASAGLREQAVELLGVIDATDKEKVAALTASLKDGEATVAVLDIVRALEKFGRDAAPALPLLKPLRFSSDDKLREAATKAIAAIEKAINP